MLHLPLTALFMPQKLPIRQKRARAVKANARAYIRRVKESEHNLKLEHARMHIPYILSMGNTHTYMSRMPGCSCTRHPSSDRRVWELGLRRTRAAQCAEN